jgi:hypothetical protein
VREQVAENPSTSIELLRILAKDRSKDVRNSVANSLKRAN